MSLEFRIRFFLVTEIAALYLLKISKKLACFFSCRNLFLTKIHSEHFEKFPYI